MKAANLNPLFISLIHNYSHLVTSQEQSKYQFLETIKKTYCLSNPKNLLFYSSVERSDFDTIKLNRTKSEILFNH